MLIKGESRPNGQCKINKQECAAKQVTDWERSWEETYETLVELRSPSKLSRNRSLEDSKIRGLALIKNG